MIVYRHDAATPRSKVRGDATLEKDNEMAELTNKEKERPEIEPGTQIELTPVADLLAGFTPDEIAGLKRVKAAVAAGQYSDITEEYKKLLFVKWLMEHDRIGS
jgi:hypothetical protein